MFVLVDEKHITEEWSDFTLVLPAVSIGNVGQLTMDLITSSLSPNCYHIGYLHDPCILPVVGNDALVESSSSSGKLNVSAEVYKNDDYKLVLLQLRAPLVKGSQAKFCKKLVAWVNECHFKQVLVLSSVSATERVDSQIEGSPLRYLLSPSAKTLIPLFNKLSWKELEKRAKFPDANEESTEEEEFFLPGGGFTKKLYEECCRENISLAVLLTFCSEGDNISDAVNLFLFVNEWLSLVPRKEVEDAFSGKSNSFMIPASWCLMFGSPVHPQGNLF